MNHNNGGHRFQLKCRNWKQLEAVASGAAIGRSDRYEIELLPCQIAKSRNSNRCQWQKQQRREANDNQNDSRSMKWRCYATHVMQRMQIYANFLLSSGHSSQSIHPVKVQSLRSSFSFQI